MGKFQRLEEEGNKYIELKVGENFYCFDIKDIKEIISYREPHKIPCGHKDDKNFITVRDAVIELEDLGVILNKKKASVASYIIVLEKDSNQKAFIVDDVIGMMQFSPETFTPIKKMYLLEGNILEGIFHNEKQIISKISTNYLFGR